MRNPVCKPNALLQVLCEWFCNVECSLGMFVCGNVLGRVWVLQLTPEVRTASQAAPDVLLPERIAIAGRRSENHQGVSTTRHRFLAGKYIGTSCRCIPAHHSAFVGKRVHVSLPGA